MAEVKEAVTNPTIPAAPVEEKHPDGSAILKGAQGTQFWPTAEKAEAVAKQRVKGARRAFTIKDGTGKVRFATAAHQHYLMQFIVENELKTEIVEIGKVAAAKAPATAEGVMAAIKTLPEAERAAVEKQIAELLKASAKK